MHYYRISVYHTLIMPVATYSSALFAAGAEIWAYPKWQERTKYLVPPFSSDATPSLTGLNHQQISAVQALSSRIHSLTPHQALLDAFAKERDNDKGGRSAWEIWVKRHFDNWKTVQHMEAILHEEGRHPRQLIGQQGFVCKLVQISIIDFLIAHLG